ncbi:hypothetical protein PFBG_00439 [Plasmodium falciparum 7G8]|nr:hypothetical protein PFTANZ_00633 [Plasmodium falciparum Tanzania (2000708)]ETW63511.1 hypothetical protein PFMC_00570 [Plasmodium falciparum CAMP/Malaysia]EUR80432.1 hypothetical protein PFBG_00439 [Plasmodium falciparum 7G8]
MITTDESDNKESECSSRKDVKRQKINIYYYKLFIEMFIPLLICVDTKECYHNINNKCNDLKLLFAELTKYLYNNDMEFKERNRLKYESVKNDELYNIFFKYLKLDLKNINNLYRAYIILLHSRIYFDKKLWNVKNVQVREEVIKMINEYELKNTKSRAEHVLFGDLKGKDISCEEMTNLNKDTIRKGNIKRNNINKSNIKRNNINKSNVKRSNTDKSNVISDFHITSNNNITRSFTATLTDSIFNTLSETLNYSYDNFFSNMDNIKIKKNEINNITDVDYGNKKEYHENYLKVKQNKVNEEYIEETFKSDKDCSIKDEACTIRTLSESCNISENISNIDMDDEDHISFPNGRNVHDNNYMKKNHVNYDKMRVGKNKIPSFTHFDKILDEKKKKSDKDMSSSKWLEREEHIKEIKLEKNEYMNGNIGDNRNGNIDDNTNGNIGDNRNGNTGNNRNGNIDDHVIDNTNEYDEDIYYRNSIYNVRDENSYDMLYHPFVCSIQINNENYNIFISSSEEEEEDEDKRKNVILTDKFTDDKNREDITKNYPDRQFIKRKLKKIQLLNKRYNFVDHFRNVQTFKTKENLLYWIEMLKFLRENPQEINDLFSTREIKKVNVADFFEASLMCALTVIKFVSLTINSKKLYKHTLKCGINKVDNEIINEDNITMVKEHKIEEMYFIHTLIISTKLEALCSSISKQLCTYLENEKTELHIPIIKSLSILSILKPST